MVRRVVPGMDFRVGRARYSRDYYNNLQFSSGGKNREKICDFSCFFWGGEGFLRKKGVNKGPGIVLSV